MQAAPSTLSYKYGQEDAIRISVYQFALRSNPMVRHWYLADGHESGGNADDAVLKFFAKDPRIKPYSEAGWRQAHQHKTPFVGDAGKVSFLADKVTGEPGVAMAVESIVWKTTAESEATLAFWSDDTGLVRGPIYTLVKTKRGWIIDTLRTGYTGSIS